MPSKLERFAQLATFPHVFQPVKEEVMNNNFSMKGCWNKEFFKNDNPIVLELGCGRGEYTVALAQRDPNKNYIGVDIKGARIYQGAKIALDSGMKNVAFLRTRIEFISSFFADNEVSEIWVTFPDPQPLKPRKRLTSATFFNSYKRFTKENALIHLKTDSQELHAYTLEVLALNGLEAVYACKDIYSEPVLIDEVLNVKTYYESMFMNKGKTITYLKFSLNTQLEYQEPPKKEI